MTTTAKIHVPDETASTALAQTLAPHLRAGDIVMLDGALAAGKTFFTRALGLALGTDDPVTSPTYTIANIYDLPRGNLIHIDAYRLKNEREFHNLGLEDDMERAITVIEWGARLGDAFPEALSIRIDLANGETARSYTVTATDARWAPVLEALA
ncbi:tRNA (adenosine(37)-N6)-threonylcarbamoyltransferase complex ATPase subunit type 1 TsaE [Celeribacter arenosi]|uniref:tRNA threonylcarbamoyladenosine biosynthesis protein TsaE n=1 Tax=Celeribacter arenosi TaxID=792649 RepID=A0ABP7JS24_9RHOB